VIHDADRSLAAWLGTMLPPGTAVRFDPPDPAWLRRPAPQPFVAAFLYDIAEDITGLPADAALVRDQAGRPVAMQAPVRRYRLSYLLTAWSADISADHELLGSVLAGCAAAVIPADCLRGTLGEAGQAIEIQCAPSCRDAAASPAALCQALRIPPRAALTVVLVAPVLPARTDLAPPARRLDLGVAAAVPVPPPPVPRRRWERARITER
jgi:Pvc16 N-terminal domain